MSRIGTIVWSKTCPSGVGRNVTDAHPCFPIRHVPVAVLARVAFWADTRGIESVRESFQT
jgi:hypothetical protein